MFAHDLKCVIWDLDETLWRGTLAEGEAIVPRPELVALIPRLDEKGVVNSICSKNEPAAAFPALERLGLRSWFVFPAIAFAPKGPAVKGIIERLQLRAENVLFVDDHPANREEARHYCPGLMTADPGDSRFVPALERLVETASGRSRLEQYRVLERKETAKSAYPSSEAFLRDSGITVGVVRNPASLMYKDRIIELVNRSNQLNFTASRFEPGRFEALTELPGTVHGAVFAYDRHGNYGLVGFFAFDESARQRILSHFVFSCRIMNMGIEQAVYRFLRRQFRLEPLAPLEEHPLNPDYITLREGLDDRMADYVKQTHNPPARYRSAILAGCTAGIIDHYLPEILRPARYDLFHLDGETTFPDAETVFYAVYGDYGRDAWTREPFSYGAFRRRLARFIAARNKSRLILLLASELAHPHGRRRGLGARLKGRLSDVYWGRTAFRMRRCNALVRELAQGQDGVFLLEAGPFVREPAEQIDPRHFERIVIQRICAALPTLLAPRKGGA